MLLSDYRTSRPPQSHFACRKLRICWTVHPDCLQSGITQSDDLWLEGSSQSTPSCPVFILTHFGSSCWWPCAPRNYIGAIPCLCSQLREQCNSSAFHSLDALDTWSKTRRMGILMRLAIQRRSALGEDGMVPARPWVFVLEPDDERTRIFHLCVAVITARAPVSSLLLINHQRALPGKHSPPFLHSNTAGF